MFQVFLAALLAAGAMHAQVSRGPLRGKTAEMMLIYVLAGYCGVMMVALGAVAVVDPDWVAINMAQVPPGNPVMIWAGFLFLSLGVVAIMTIWHRGAFLIAPVIVWSTYWAGATYAHLVADKQNGHPLTTELFFQTFVGHGLVALILLGLSALVWRRSVTPLRAVEA